MSLKEICPFLGKERVNTHASLAVAIVVSLFVLIYFGPDMSVGELFINNPFIFRVTRALIRQGRSSTVK